MTYPNLASKSHALFERAARVLPGGNSRHTVHVDPYPAYIVKGEGCRVWDADDTVRIDTVNNYSSLIHGHCHPDVVEALQHQAATLTAIGSPTPWEIDLAELVTERVPSVDLVRFCNSGTEAVMMSIFAARAYTGRNKVAKIEGAYNGAYDCMAVSVFPEPDTWGPENAPTSHAPAGVSQQAAESTIVIQINDVENARAILKRHANDLAGVVLCPFIKNMGFLRASDPFLQMLREECTAADALLIFDEVYAFRLGFGGAQEVLGVMPDLTAMGKVIGGGLPVGALGGPKHIMEALFDARDAAPKLSHGGTFNANPMTMAAGAAAMRAYDRAAFDRLCGLGDRLRNGLREAVKISGRAGTVTGEASMVGFFHTDKPFTNYRTILAQIASTPGALEAPKHFYAEMLNRGVFIMKEGFMTLSTAMTEEDIDFICEAALGALRNMPTTSEFAA